MTIKRTKIRADGGITKEEKEKMDIITKKWIDIAKYTGKIIPEKIVPAIEELYRVSGI